MKGREFPIPRQFCHEYEIPYWEDNLANPGHCMILGPALAEAQRAALEEAKRYRAMRSDRDGRA